MSSLENSMEWRSKPSHLTFLKDYILCILFFWLIFPIVVGIHRFLTIKTTTYAISQGRLIVSRGVLAKTVDELELYRVKDYRVTQSFFQRLFGVGALELMTSDKTHPLVSLGLIKDPVAIKDMIRDGVEKLRTAKGVREFD